MQARLREAFAGAAERSARREMRRAYPGVPASRSPVQDMKPAHGQAAAVSRERPRAAPEPGQRDELRHLGRELSVVRAEKHWDVQRKLIEIC